jgi:hypothetical protein
VADFELTFNTAQLIAGAEAAWNPANQVLGREFQKRITANQWPWPTGDSPRDIVDTGQLRDSYQGDAETPTTYRHAWATEYALAVHEGAVLENGGVMPARPWVRVTLRDYDFAAAYSKLAEAEMRKRSP